MKKFFKKIAFVSAMAMVVSAMPAQSATAAEGPQMYKTLKFYLGGDMSGKFSDDAKYAKVWNWKDVYETVEFASDNEDVATVNAKGKVTPVGVGTANVTATFYDEETGSAVDKVCAVTVKNNAVEAGIGDGSADILKNMTVGDKYLVKTYRTDANGETDWKGKDVITDSARFTSSNPDVFTVTKTGGTVTAVGAGEATLNVWAVQSEGATWNEDHTKVEEYLRTTPIKTYPVVVKAPEAHDRAVLTIPEGAETLVANGVAGTIVTFTLYESDGSIATETKDVQVKLSTTRGTLASDYVTLEGGVANVLFTTPILSVEAAAMIQATVVSAGADAQDLINVKAEPIIINLKPEEKADAGDSTVGAKVLGSVVETADRITLYFDKPVTASSFKEAGKYELYLGDNVGQTGASYLDGTVITEGAVSDILNVTDNARALTFVFNDSVKVLTDNTRYMLNFVDKRYDAPMTSTGIDGYVTDAVMPSVLSVIPKDNISMKQLVVTFSEPIDCKTFEGQFAIDGYALGDNAALGLFASDKYGVSVASGGERAKVERAEGSARTTFTITLGKDKDGNQIFFEAGKHSLTIYNVSDHAGRTDANNIVASQVLTFTIVEDTNAPDFNVTVMSPEQYLLDFTCYLEKNLAPADVVLQYSEKGKNNWVNVDTIGQDTVLRAVDAQKKYVLEVDTDWTEIFKGTNTNYYNYDFRIQIGAEKLVNATNGKKNATELNKNLTSAKMLTVDVDHPIVDAIGIVPNSDNKKVQVTFSEPVQSAGLAMTLTPSTLQLSGVPHTTVYFVSKDTNLSKTYAGTIVGIDALDQTMTISLASALDAGDYYLYIRNITDDIGNTSPTAPYTFTVAGAPAKSDEFKITGAWADAKYGIDGVKSLDAVTATDLTKDAIYVRFSMDFYKAGGTESVLNNTNWSINGMPLPAGTVIVTGIPDGDNDTTNDMIGVTILLPNGTLTNIDETVITLSGEVVDADGKIKLSAPWRVQTQYGVR